MKEKYTYWKRVAFNMLFAYQALFLGTTAWDFFLTVIVQSHRSLIFTSLGAGLSALLIWPWIIGIFILTIMLLIYMINEDYQLVLAESNFDYIGMILLYLILFLLAMFNPMTAWPIMLNYLVNIGWAGSLIYFRLALKKDKSTEI